MCVHSWYAIPTVHCSSGGAVTLEVWLRKQDRFTVCSIAVQGRFDCNTLLIQGAGPQHTSMFVSMLSPLPAHHDACHTPQPKPSLSDQGGDYVTISVADRLFSPHPSASVLTPAVQLGASLWFIKSCSGCSDESSVPASEPRVAAMNCAHMQSSTAADEQIKPKHLPTVVASDGVLYMGSSRRHAA